TDSPLSPTEQAELQKYYATAYQELEKGAGENDETDYLRVGREGSQKADVTGNIQAFVKYFGLRDKKVLDIGAGRGFLQDEVNDYTGLEISSTARRFYHKRFV